MGPLRLRTVGAVDARAIVRPGLIRALEAETGLSVVGQACTAKDALALCRDRRPEATIVGLSIAGADSLENATQLLHPAIERVRSEEGIRS